MKITVKAKKGTEEHVFDVEVQASDDAAVLVDRITSELKVGKEALKLVYAGRIVKEGKTVESYRLKDGAALFAVVSARTTRTAEPEQEENQPQVSSMFGASRSATSNNNRGNNGNANGLPQGLAGLLGSGLAHRQIDPNALRHLIMSTQNNPERMQSLLGWVGTEDSLVHRSIFDEAMEHMNGADLPLGYPPIQLSAPFPRLVPTQQRAGYGQTPRNPALPPSSRPGQQQQQQQQRQQSSQPSPGANRFREVVSRDRVFSALAQAMAVVEGGTSTSTPSQPMSSPPTSSKNEEKAQQAPAETTASTSEDRAATEAKEETATGTHSSTNNEEDTSASVENAQQDQQHGDPPSNAHRYAAQLQTMRDMGFVDEVACLQALEAAEGDVNIALQFLM